MMMRADLLVLIPEQRENINGKARAVKQKETRQRIK
jgi:hypothetical protein